MSPDSQTMPPSTRACQLRPALDNAYKGETAPPTKSAPIADESSNEADTPSLDWLPLVVVYQVGFCGGSRHQALSCGLSRATDLFPHR